MKKNILGLSAIALAIGFSAFNLPSSSKLVNTIYQYTGPQPQSISSRQSASNYTKVSSITCPNGEDECAVTLTDDFGTQPNFTNVTFDASGFPNGGSAFVSNGKKPD